MVSRYFRYFRYLRYVCSHQISVQGAVSNGAWFPGSKSNSDASSLLPEEADEGPKVEGRDPDDHLGDEPGAAKSVRGVAEPSERELPSRRCCRHCWLDTQVTLFMVILVQPNFRDLEYRFYISLTFCLVLHKTCRFFSYASSSRLYPCQSVSQSVSKS